MTRTKIGYIGLDHHHRDPYFQVIDQLPAELIAVCEPNEDFDVDSIAAVQDRPDAISSEDLDVGSMIDNAAVYRDPEELIATEDVDVVWLTLPNRDTPAVIESAIDEGVHVLSEKTAARTAGDLEPLADRTEETGVTVGVTYFYRTHPAAKEMRQLNQEGFFGDVWSIESRYIGSKLAMRNTSHFEYDKEASRGGVLQWLGVHWIDLIMYILDEPITRVNARTRNYAGAEIEDGAAVQFEMASGTIGTFQNGYYLESPEKDSTFAIYGSDGTARSSVTKGEEPISLELSSYSEEWMGAPDRTIDFDLAYDELPSWGDTVLEFFQKFFDAIESDEQVPADIRDGVAVLKVLDAIYESAETGEWVDTGC